MTYADAPCGALDYMPWRYGNSKLVFRGPRRRLEGNYALFMGGTETYGKFIADPFPSIVERGTGVRCVNFGWPNAGVDAFAIDRDILCAASQATVNIVQITGAQNVTNPFYSVHPRRNDRFVAASAALQRLYPEVDFMEFHFTRHMLGRLWQVSPRRYAQVREAARHAWVQKMRGMMQKIGIKTILLWVSGRAMNQSVYEGGQGDLNSDPVFVTAQMVALLRPYVVRVVEATVSADALSKGTEGMIFNALEAPAAAEMLGPHAHREVADALIPSVASMAAQRH